MIHDFEKEGAVVIGISSDSENSHARFVEKYDLKVQLLSDPAHQVLEKYGVWQKKKMYGKEYMGVIRTTYLIDPQGIVAKAWESVKVKGHAAAVKETLLALKDSA
jgi:peroxiredoxin Q/BCP